VSCVGLGDETKILAYDLERLDMVCLRCV
jgi:hypothetical protein